MTDAEKKAEEFAYKRTESNGPINRWYALKEGYLAGYAEGQKEAKEQGAREMAEIAAQELTCYGPGEDTARACEVENYMQLRRERNGKKV